MRDYKTLEAAGALLGIGLVLLVFFAITLDRHTLDAVVDSKYEATDGACFAVIIIADEPHLVSISTELFLSIEKAT